MAEKNIEEMLESIHAQNNYIIQVLSRIMLESGGSLVEKRDDEALNRIAELSKRLSEHLNKRELTDKQYILLKYHLKHPYINDVKLALNAGVSYSSITQWKSKDKLFKAIYDEIKAHK